jgi:hypothetical protein
MAILPKGRGAAERSGSTEARLGASGAAGLKSVRTSPDRGCAALGDPTSKWHYQRSRWLPPRIAMPVVLRLLGAMFCLALLGFALTADAKPSNKWRIECSSDADSNGVVTLLLSPKGAEPIEVAIPIAKGTGENAVARRIRDGLKADERVAKRYKLEVDDGEDVLVKKRRGEPDFDLKVVSNTVKGFRINLDRE